MSPDRSGAHPVRVMHITQPVSAGVAVVVSQLAADQARRGDDVTIVCPPDGLRSGPLADAIANHDEIRGIAWAATRSPGPKVADETRRLRSIVRAERPDVVVLHAAKAGLAGRLAIRGRVPTIYAPHAWSFEAVTGPTAKASLAWERTSARWTTTTVCVSTDERDRGFRAGISGDMTVIDNGVDLEHFAVGERDVARHELGLADVPTAVCVGRLTHQKGQDRLIELWPAVRQVIPDAQLVLVGDGPDELAMRNQAGDGIVFAGAQTDTRPFFAAADIVCVASRWEGAALVVLEAMSSGRCVVGMQVDGLRRALGATGAIVAADDTPAFATAIINLLSDPVRADAEGRAARIEAERRHALATTTDRWNHLIEQVAGVRQGSSAPPVADLVEAGHVR